MAAKIARVQLSFNCQIGAYTFIAWDFGRLVIAIQILAASIAR